MIYQNALNQQQQQQQQQQFLRNTIDKPQPTQFVQQVIPQKPVSVQISQQSSRNPSPPQIMQPQRQ